MDVFEAIDKRHSYRGPFKPQPLPREDLRRIVQAGIQAPSGKNLQTTSFVIIDDPDLVAGIRSLHTRNQAMQAAQAYIACIVDRNQPATGFHVEDCAAAVENMLLAVTALGYASVWVDGWLRAEGRAEKIGQMIGVPPAKVVRVILPIGVAAEKDSQAERKPFPERAWFNRYGA